MTWEAKQPGILVNALEKIVIFQWYFSTLNWAQKLKCLFLYVPKYSGKLQMAKHLNETFALRIISTNLFPMPWLQILIRDVEDQVGPKHKVTEQFFSLCWLDFTSELYWQQGKVRQIPYVNTQKPTFRHH